jgi:hypothetical protein
MNVLFQILDAFPNLCTLMKTAPWLFFQGDKCLPGQHAEIIEAFGMDGKNHAEFYFDLQGIPACRGSRQDAYMAVRRIQFSRLQPFTAEFKFSKLPAKA